jgi:peroxiredoxin
VSLADFQNTVVFVNVWATWCKPCKEELPALAKVYDILHKEGFEVLAITNDDAKKVRGFLKKIPLPFTILIDSKERVFNRFRVDRVPTALVIDKAGRLALRHTGPVDWTSPLIIDTLRSLIVQTADE